MNFCPSELMCGAERPSIFRQMIEREICRTQEKDSTTQKIKEAYTEMKRKAFKRESRRKREGILNGTLK
jgi:hypothetical protein